MLKINRLRIEIHTADGLYGFDNSFSSGLNIIASDDNTRGKSSIISAILYGLGCEELLGGQGSKVLTPAFFSQLVDDNKKIHIVIQSCVYLEISNGTDVVTIYRAIKNEKREEKLVTVYSSELGNIFKQDVNKKDYFVLLKNAAKNDVGFHKFLSEFVNLQLPVVYDYNDNEHSLYIQQIIAALVIEQKSGWTDLLCRVPYFNVPGVKQRVIEYWLDIRRNEAIHIKKQIDREEKEISYAWKYACKNIEDQLIGTEFKILNNPLYPEVLTEEKLETIDIQINDTNISDYILRMSNKLSEINNKEPLIKDNCEKLHDELLETEKQITDLRSDIQELLECRCLKKQNLNKQKHSLCQIINDIQNNNDAKTLKKLGADIGLNYANEVCPICKQHINDSLLPFETTVMSIEDNLKHLKAQKNMLEYSITMLEPKIAYIDRIIDQNNKVLADLEKIAFSIRSDIMSNEQNYSETIIRKKILLEEKISNYKSLQDKLKEYKSKLKELSHEWKNLLIKKSTNTNSNTDTFDEKISDLRNRFVSLLYAFHFESVPDTQKDRIKISPDTLLPVIDEFDMKFGASASDNIRMVWAYTLALLSNSNKYSKSKLNIAIFDEPKQQSIVDNDFISFVENTLEICQKENSQIILGVTAKDTTQNIINDINNKGATVINIFGKAFKKLS